MIGPFVQGFTIFMVAASGYFYFQNKYGDMVAVKSNVDGEMYFVQNVDGKQEVADILARMRQRMLRLLAVLERESGVQDVFCRASIEQLRDRFRADRISESPTNSEHTSYSVNKGEQLFFCVRPKRGVSTAGLMDDNTMFFVGIHELAHIMTRSIGHTPEFWANFRFLLRVAVKNGIYTYQDFRKAPTPYCGISITDTPYHPGLDDVVEGENTTQSCR